MTCFVVSLKSLKQILMMMMYTFYAVTRLLASKAVKYHAAVAATTFGLTDVAKLCGKTKQSVLKWIVTNIEQHRYNRLCFYCTAAFLQLVCLCECGCCVCDRCWSSLMPSLKTTT